MRIQTTNYGLVIIATVYVDGNIFNQLEEVSEIRVPILDKTITLDYVVSEEITENEVEDIINSF